MTKVHALFYALLAALSLMVGLVIEEWPLLSAQIPVEYRWLGPVVLAGLALCGALLPGVESGKRPAQLVEDPEVRALIDKFGQAAVEAVVTQLRGTSSRP